MSIRSAMAAALVFAGVATAAPMPYAPEGAAEALFDASTPERANALVNFVRSAEFATEAARQANRADAGQTWVSLHLKAEIVGGTAVRLTMGGNGMRERQALAGLRAVVRVVAEEPGKAEMARLVAAMDQQRQMNNEVMGGKRFAARRMIIRDGSAEMPLANNAALDIRMNRPALKGAPRLSIR